MQRTAYLMYNFCVVLLVSIRTCFASFPICFFGEFSFENLCKKAAKRALVRIPNENAFSFGNALLAHHVLCKVKRSLAAKSVYTL